MEGESAGRTGFLTEYFVGGYEVGRFFMFFISSHAYVVYHHVSSCICKWKKKDVGHAPCASERINITVLISSAGEGRTRALGNHEYP